MNWTESESEFRQRGHLASVDIPELCEENVVVCDSRLQMSDTGDGFEELSY